LGRGLARRKFAGRPRGLGFLSLRLGRGLRAAVLAERQSRAARHAQRADKGQGQKTLHRKPPLGIESGEKRLSHRLGTVRPPSVGLIAVHEGGGTRTWKKGFPVRPAHVRTAPCGAEAVTHPAWRRWRCKPRARCCWVNLPPNGGHPVQRVNSLLG